MDLFNSYITNPVVGSVKSIGSIFVRTASTTNQKDSVEALVKNEMKNIQNELVLKQTPFGYQNLPRISRGFLKLAALSGCAAVVMSAYGSHNFNRRQDTTKDMRELYFTAQYYHLVHSVALLGVPLVPRPKITGVLWMSGILLFCGTMYYHALTEDKRLRSLTPYGGFCLIAGWLSILI